MLRVRRAPAYNKRYGRTATPLVRSPPELPRERPPGHSAMPATTHRHRRRRNRPLVLALYVNAVLLAAILVALLSRAGGIPSVLPAAFAGPAIGQPIAGG